jgi:diguanylate cyclase (GGDEF)-like protein
MRLFQNSSLLLRWFLKIWEGLVAPAWIGDARERHLSRILNSILLFLLGWGIIVEIQYRLGGRPSSNTLILIMLITLGFAYYLNRMGHFRFATLLTLGLFTSAMFISALIEHWSASGDLSVLYYLIVAILMGELFFSMKGYLVTVGLILAGLLGISLLNSNAGNIFLFLLGFSALVGFSSYNRRLIEKKQIALAGKLASEQSLRSTEARRAALLGLLEEVSRQITESLDEKEIIERTLKAIVDKFGYTEATISLLVNEDSLEVFAITGTQAFGHRPGYPQKVGNGIIGHVAEIREPYITNDILKDPYYYSSTERGGSAVGIPMLDKDVLLGVIHVESNNQGEFEYDDMRTLQALADLIATALQKARLYARTQEHLRVMTTLQSISHAVSSSLELDKILHNVIELLKDSFGYTYISIYLLDGEILCLGAEIGYPKGMTINEIPIASGVIGRAVRTKQTQYLRDVSTDPTFLQASYEVKSEIGVPLLKEDKVLGVLNVESDRNVPLDENDVNLLNTLAGSVAVAIDNARLHAEVKRMALTDAVSGLANRRAFDDYMQTEIRRAKRYGGSLSLIILDLDSFKQYNDTWGHPAGDVRLREIGDLLSAKVRDPDIVARYGGEEFAVILPNTSKEGAIVLAERLRIFAEEYAPLKHNDGSPVPGYTISLGVATFPEDADTLDELLIAADNAELSAKQLGKNRVCVANSSNSPYDISPFHV